MFSLSRMHLTYANVTATLALVFAMSGGALAANHYLLTSTKQISPKVLRALRADPGPKGNLGIKGEAGPPGKTGPEGKAGVNGVSVTSRAFTGAAGDCTAGGAEFTAANGVTFACNGQNAKELPIEHERKEPAPWPSYLPSSRTETGTWGFESNGEGLARVPISFPVPTNEPLEPIMGRGPVELVEPKEEDPLDAHPNCPGTVASPKADPGYICIYAEKLEDTLAGEGALHTSGVVLSFDSTSASPKVDEGTWAMTAP